MESCVQGQSCQPSPEPNPNKYQFQPVNTRQGNCGKNKICIKYGDAHYCDCDDNFQVIKINFCFKLLFKTLFFFVYSKVNAKWKM